MSASGPSPLLHPIILAHNFLSRLGKSKASEIDFPDTYYPLWFLLWGGQKSWTEVSSTRTKPLGGDAEQVMQFTVFKILFSSWRGKSERMHTG